MTPRLAMSNSRDMRSAYSVLPSNSSIILLSNTERKNSFNFLLGQLGLMVVLSIWHSALLGCITRIVAWRAKKKMVWIRAEWIITFMADKHSLWNKAVMQLPACAIRPPVLTARYKCTVPKADGTTPSPATIMNYCIAPELLFHAFCRIRYFPCALSATKLTATGACTKLIPAILTYFHYLFMQIQAILLPVSIKYSIKVR